jgi:hypothetical protein
MLPIHSVLQDIRNTLGAKEVFIPVQDEITQQSHTSLRPGRLCDIIAKEKSDLVEQGGQFQDPTNSPKKDSLPNLQAEHSSTDVPGKILPQETEGLPRKPKPVLRRPPLPGERESSFSGT